MYRYVHFSPVQVNVRCVSFDAVEIYAAFERNVPIVLRCVAAHVQGGVLNIVSTVAADMLFELSKFINIDTAECAVEADKLRELNIIGADNVHLLTAAVLRAMAAGQMSSLFSSTMIDGLRCGEPEALYTESNEFVKTNELVPAALSSSVAVFAELYASSNYYCDLTEALRGVCRMGRGDVVNFILTIGVNLDAPSDRENHYNAIAYAALSGHFDIIKMLAGAGASLDVKDVNGCTPLLLMVLGQEEKLVEYFVSVGSNLNDTDNVRRLYLSAVVLYPRA